MKKKVVCLGSFVVDLTSFANHLPKPAETVMGSKFLLGPGGKGSNQAVAAKRAGADITMITKVGNDIFGQLALKNFKKEGFNLDNILIDEETPTGTALIAVDENTGQNQILVVLGACGNISSEDMKKVEHVISSCDIFLTQLETNLDSIISGINTASRNGALVVLNTAPVQTIPEGLLKKVDIVTPNEIEASYLTGVEVKDLCSAAEASKVFLKRGVKAVVITMGKSGSYVNDGKNELHIPPLPVKAVDTTGAGDAFTGGLVTALSEGKDIFSAARFGTAAASISITRYGTAPAMPYSDEILKMCKEFNII